MKIKEVQAGVKISRNYNSYQINLVADIEDDETPEKVGGELIDKAKEILEKEMKFHGEGKEISGVEVGAAWIHKKSPNFLSVQFSKSGLWEDVRIRDLEKVGDGYKQKTKEGVLIFKKIPSEKRKNYKMPIFRIYKIEEEIKEQE